VHKDGWYVVDAFVGCCNCCAHPTSLTQISFSRENSHEMSAVCSKKSTFHTVWRLVRRLWHCSLCTVFDEFENKYKREAVVERVPREVPVLFW